MSPFSITLVAKNIGPEEKDLLQAAEKQGVKINVRDVLPDEKTEGFDKVVIWRGSSVGTKAKRTAVLQKIHENGFLINPCLALYPEATRKSFQQNFFSETKRPLHTIPTHTFPSREALEYALTQGILQYPFIEKPDIGNRGRGVRVIHSKKDLSSDPDHYRTRIYQKFIRNNGDYRVLVVGGKALGVMKRTAPENSLINNISQGGTGEMVTDTELHNFLCTEAEMIARHLSLLLCGIDIIQDEETGAFYFLESNSIPEWQGFQKATGVNVASKIIRFCLQFLERDFYPIEQLVRENYLSSLENLRHKKFHFLSRLYLWTGDSSLKPRLQKEEERFLGKGGDDTTQLLKNILKQKTPPPLNTPRQIFRKATLEKYPDLMAINAVLFRKLYAKTLYQKDISLEVSATLNEDELRNLFDLLQKDSDAITKLSSHAVNFLFLASWHLEKESSLTPFFFDQFLKTPTPPFSSEELHLALYLLTHCIIGQSLYYSQPLSDQWQTYYRQKMIPFDEILTENFKEVSLDAKLEFLVCARMIGFASVNSAPIIEEARQSLSPRGNFLIDILNSSLHPRSPQNFLTSEHRNVLYLMSMSPSALYEDTLFA